MYFGVDQRGSAYESFGTGNFFPVAPFPFLSQLTFIDRPADWGGLPSPSRFTGADPLIFREDHFDAVSRTRRGRLYERREGTQPNQDAVLAVGGDTAIVPLFVYQAPWRLINTERRLSGATVALGTNVFASAWKVLGVEMVGAGDVLLTLRALSTFGVIPELNTEAVPAAFLPAIEREMQALVDAAFRQSPSAVVDRCRNVLMVAVSAWLETKDSGTNARGLELSKLADKLRSLEKQLAANAVATVAILHARSKPNVQHQLKIAAPSDEDAMLALQETGAVIREFGWARPT